MNTNSHDLTAHTEFYRPMKQDIGLTNNLQLRFLGPGDVDEVRGLCCKWFPIEYVESLILNVFVILNCLISCRQGV